MSLGRRNPSGSETREKGAGANIRNPMTLIAFILFILAAIVSCSSGEETDTWNCTRYDPPFRVVSVKYETDYFGGVDQPDLSRFRGITTGGAAEVEVSCSKSGTGTYYLLRGADWWGWVRSSDAQ